MNKETSSSQSKAISHAVATIEKQFGKGVDHAARR